MDTYLLVIAILLGLLLLVFLGMGVYAVYFITKIYRPKSATPAAKQDSFEYFCTNHPEEYSQGICAICERGYCGKCLREVDKIHFCPEHFNVFINNEWDLLAEVRTTAQTPETANYVYSFKKNIWKEGIPSYVVTHYRLNVEGDFVESYVNFFVKKLDAQTLGARLEQNKAESSKVPHLS